MVKSILELYINETIQSVNFLTGFSIMCNGQDGAVRRGGCSDNAVTVAAAVISDQMMAADIIHRAPVITNNNTPTILAKQCTV